MELELFRKLLPVYWTLMVRACYVAADETRQRQGTSRLLSGDMYLSLLFLKFIFWQFSCNHFESTGAGAFPEVIVLNLNGSCVLHGSRWDTAATRYFSTSFGRYVSVLTLSKAHLLTVILAIVSSRLELELYRNILYWTLVIHTPCLMWTLKYSDTY